MFLVYCMFCFATIVFNTRINVYSQGNRKCSFLPGCACLYLYWLTHITCFENKWWWWTPETWEALMHWKSWRLWRCDCRGYTWTGSLGWWRSWQSLVRQSAEPPFPASLSCQWGSPSARCPRSERECSNIPEWNLSDTRIREPAYNT